MSRRRVLFLVSLLAVCCCDGRSGDRGTSEPAGGEGGTGSAAGESASFRDSLPRRPHILLYLIDTLRADHLGSYGYSQPTSPFVDSLAADSTLFESAIAQGPWTVPSVTSLMTSRYTSVHGMVNIKQQVPPSTVTLVEMLRDAGYETFGFTQSPFTGTLTGLDQGYQALVEQPLGRLSAEQRAEGVNSLRPFFRWLEGWEPDGPVFVFIHTAEPHWPLRDLNPRFFSAEDSRKARELNEIFTRFRELSRYKETFDTNSESHLAYLKELREIKATLAEQRPEIVRLYDNAVRVADHNLREVVEGFRSKGVWDHTVFGLLSDHGEEMLDHGYWLHDQSLYAELIRVPLILRIPGLTETGHRVSSPVELIDLAPTLADLVGVPAPDSWQGRSILGQVAGQPAIDDRAAFSERINTRKYDAEILATRGNSEVTLVQRDWKLVDHYGIGRRSLFDRVADPTEQRDLSRDRPDLVENLYSRIQLWRNELEENDSDEPRDVELGAQELEDLQALGYVDGPRGSGADSAEAEKPGIQATPPSGTPAR